MLASTLILLCAATFTIAKCPSGGIRGLKKDVCYKFFTDTTWHDARLQCTGEGGSLAVVTNAFVDVLLASVPRDVCRPAGDNYYWLGASIGVDDAEAWKPQWEWVDGSNFSYAAWAPGQPSNKIPQCLSFNAADNARWYSADCNKDLPFICQFTDSVAPTKVPATGQTPAPGSTTCRSGWTYYEQTEKCYKMVYGYNFNDAWSACLGEASNLASIHSDAENSVIKDFASTRLSFTTGVWIGLYDKNHDRNFGWTDGTPFDYNNWAPQEPDASGNGQYCVRFIADDIGGNAWDVVGAWDDVGCSDGLGNSPSDDNVRGAICQAPANI